MGRLMSTALLYGGKMDILQVMIKNIRLTITRRKGL